MIPLVIIGVYFVSLIGLGFLSNRLARGTTSDFFTADRSIGPFVLLMSIFGTTMTAFALVGSTGESYRVGIGVYGMMASWSALVHAGVFFMVGVRLWAYGRRYGYVTQIQYLRERFESPWLGTLLFPVIVGLAIPYVLVGVIGAGGVINSLTVGAFPGLFASTKGGIPAWLTGLVICVVVLHYIFYGGVRGAAWANTFQTLVFMGAGVITFIVIADRLGGMEAATRRVLEARPEMLVRDRTMTPLQFMSYGLVPLSVGMFPHVFQHWLTARSARSFRMTIVGHPLCILVVWLPCVLIGVWATSALMPDGSLVVPPEHPPNSELATMVQKLTGPVLTGLLGAGILSAIVGGLDSQFLCLGTMFTEDIVVHHFGRDRFTERQTLLIARGFIILIVAGTYLLSFGEPRAVFRLGVWTFSGFTSLFPLLFAALYWKGVTKAGGAACILTAVVSWSYLFYRSDFGAKGEELIFGMMPVAPMFAASTLALVAVSLVTKPPSPRTLERFFPTA